jgi:hypothetical protein
MVLGQHGFRLAAAQGGRAGGWPGKHVLVAGVGVGHRRDPPYQLADPCGACLATCMATLPP